MKNEPSISEVSVLAWLYEHDIKTETGIPLDFRDHRFLLDIYDDLCPNLVCLKSAQIGFSTLAILKSFWISGASGLDIIYTLPSLSDVQDFVGGKVNRIIAQNPILLEYTKDKDSVEQKKVGENVIYYRGTWTSKAALMVSSDLNIHDEYDASKQDVIDQYESRLQHSKYAWKWIFSNPSMVDVGVDKFWQISDQRHWTITCPSCKEKQYLDFPESIDMEKECYQCKKCKAELPDDARRNGFWKAKYPGRKWHGYWISLLMAPWVPASKILEYHKTKSIEYFYNFVLGLPYLASENKPTKSMITRNLTDDVNLQEGNIVIGVDTGIDIRYVISNEDGIFNYGECQDYEKLDEFMKRWKNAKIVMDQGGDIIGPRKLMEKYPGRVYLCHYRADRKTKQLVRWGDKDEDGTVLVDRNRMIQLVIDEFMDRRWPIYGTESEFDKYWLHWNHIYRTQKEDHTTQKMRYVWERNGRDDWVHATIYCRVGLSRFSGKGFILGQDVPFFGTAPEISPDGTMPAPNPSKFIYPEKTDEQDWRNI